MNAAPYPAITASQVLEALCGVAKAADTLAQRGDLVSTPSGESLCGLARNCEGGVSRWQRGASLQHDEAGLHRLRDKLMTAEITLDLISSGRLGAHASVIHDVKRSVDDVLANM